jgi:hypothetical protein
MTRPNPHAALARLLADPPPGWPDRATLLERLLEALERGDALHAHQLVGVLTASGTWAGDR